MPLDILPTEWPALPIRWMSRVTWRGELYWTTQSRNPMSMPS
jgi:hypothetical protein